VRVLKFKIIPTVDSIAATKKYSEELSMAAAQMESLNSLYKVQLESASRNAEANKEIAENASKLKEQMQSMTANIASLNNVYGGMLTAMSNKG
jgi:gliding motility-associated protein GldL